MYEIFQKEQQRIQASRKDISVKSSQNSSWLKTEKQNEKKPKRQSMAHSRQKQAAGRETCCRQNATTLGRMKILARNDKKNSRAMEAWANGPSWPGKAGKNSQVTSLESSRTRLPSRQIMTTPTWASRKGWNRTLIWRNTAKKSPKYEEHKRCTFCSSWRRSMQLRIKL